MVQYKQSIFIDTMINGCLIFKAAILYKKTTAKAVAKKSNLIWTVIIDWDYFQFPSVEY